MNLLLGNIQETPLMLSAEGIIRQRIRRSRWRSGCWLLSVREPTPSCHSPKATSMNGSICSRVADGSTSNQKTRLPVMKSVMRGPFPKPQKATWWKGMLCSFCYVHKHRCGKTLVSEFLSLPPRLPQFVPVTEGHQPQCLWRLRNQSS